MMTMMQNAPIQAVLLMATFTDVGFLMGVVRNLPYVLLSPFTAVFLIRLGWRAPLPLSGLFMIVSSFLMFIASDLSTVLFSQLFMGAALFCFFPCGESIVSQTFDGSGRLKAFSLFLSAVSGGFLLGSVFSGLVAYILGLKQIFILAAAISAVACILFSRINPTPTLTKNQNTKPTAKAALPILYSTPYFIVLASTYAFFPGYFVLQGLSEFEVGLLFFTLMLSRVLTSYSLSRMKPANVNRLLPALSGLTAFSFFLTLQNPGFIAFYPILFILVGAAVSVAYVLTLYLASDKYEGQNPVFLIGMLETLIGSSFLLGPLLTGYVADVYGFGAVLTLFGLSMIVGGLFSLRHRV